MLGGKTPAGSLNCDISLTALPHNGQEAHPEINPPIVEDQMECRPIQDFRPTHQTQTDDLLFTK